MHTRIGTESDTRCCGNCEFFDVDDAEDLSDPEGMCRRHAPRAVLAHDEDGKPLHRFTLFPVVIASEWCGEFRVLNHQHGNETTNNGRTAD